MLSGPPAYAIHPGHGRHRVTVEPDFIDDEEEDLALKTSPAEVSESNEIIARQHQTRAKRKHSAKFVRIPTEAAGARPATTPNSWSLGPAPAASLACQRELWGRRLDEVTTPILAKPQLSQILRTIRRTIREAQGAGWEEVELTLTPGVYRVASKEFGLDLGHNHAMPTQSERVHNSAAAMVRHVVHESVKAFNPNSNPNPK